MDVSEQSGQRRLRAIERLRVLERVGDPALEAVTRVAAYVTGARAAAVHILDDTEQRRIVATGASLVSGPVAESMCQEVLAAGRSIVAADASCDPRFAGSPFVRGESPVRFYAAVPLADSEGTILGTVCAFDTEPREITPVQLQRLEDLAAQAQAHIELMALAADLGDAAMLDPMTGAVNSVMFEDRLEQALTRSRRYGRRVLVALLDVDRFKDFNDSRGHAVGDQVLREVVGRLRSVARQEDTIGRLGGDEFAVIAEVTPAGGELLLKRLDDAFGAGSRLVSGVSVTIGAALAEPGDEPRTAIERADRAMYEAKRRRPDRRPGSR